MNAVMSVIETSRDKFVIQSSICALCVLSTGNSNNCETIGQKCPLKPLINTLIELLKPSRKDYNASLSVKTMPIHEPEFVTMLEKLLLVIKLVCAKQNRVEEITHLEGMNVIELLLSILCFLQATERKQSSTVPHNVDSCFNIIVNILSKLCSTKIARDYLIAQLKVDKPVEEDNFYVLVQGKPMNGAKLIMNQFMSSNLTYASELSLFLAEIAEYEPRTIITVIDKFNGKDSFYVKCLSFLKSSTVEESTRLNLAKLLGNIISNRENLSGISDIIQRDMANTMSLLLGESNNSTLQTAGFLILRHMNLENETLINNCIQLLDKSIPIHRSVDWMLQLDYRVESNQKILFVLLEALKNHVAKEKVSGDQVAHLGLLPLLIELLKSSVFKEISLFMIGRLAKSSQVRDQFVRLGGMELVVPMLAHDTSDYFVDVITIISKMSDKNRMTQITVAELGGLQMLIRLLHKFANTNHGSPSKSINCESTSSRTHKIQLLLNSCVKSLVELEQNSIYATKLRAVEALIPYCHSLSSSLVENVVASLLHLSSIDANRKQIAQCEILVVLLDCENSTIQETVCNVLCNTALSSDCREILVQNGAYEKIQNLVESDDQLLSLFAQMALNHFKQIDVRSLQRKAFELVKRSNIDYEQKKKDIESTYVRQYESMIKRSSIQASNTTAFDSLAIEVDWTFFDNLKTDDQKRSALHLLKRNMWDNLRTSIGTYCDQSTHHSQALLQAVRRIVVQFAEISSVLYEPSKEKSSVHALNDGTLYYNVGFDEMNSIPVKDFVAQLNNLFMSNIKKFKRTSTLNPKDTESMISVPRPDVLSNALQNPIEVLEKLAREAVNGPLQLQAVINLVNNEPYNKLPASDEEAIAKMKQQVLLFEEKFIKAYKVIKINKDGLKQERFLLLTDKSYYTVKYDYTKKDHDKKHSKRYHLRDLFVIDVGHFEKTDDKFFLNLYMKQKMNKSRGFSVARRLSNQTLGVDLFDDNARLEFAQMRPNTDSCNYNLLTPPYASDNEWIAIQKSHTEKEHCQRNLQLMQEISWVLFAAASQMNGLEIWAPFSNQVLQKPAGKLSSFIYNKFKFGKL